MSVLTFVGFGEMVINRVSPQLELFHPFHLIFILSEKGDENS